MYILIVVLGIALVAFGLSRLAAYARARTWPATEGRLAEFSVASAAEHHGGRRFIDIGRGGGWHIARLTIRLNRSLRSLGLPACGVQPIDFNLNHP
jgi:hypothetical protein